MSDERTKTNPIFSGNFFSDMGKSWNKTLDTLLTVIAGLEFELQRLQAELERRAPCSQCHKPIREFWQIDGFKLDGPDDLMHPDENGYSVLCGHSSDPRTSDESLPVRVQIIKGSNKEDALHLLEEIAKVVKNHWDDDFMSDQIKPAERNDNGIAPDEVPF